MNNYEKMREALELVKIKLADWGFTTRHEPPPPGSMSYDCARLMEVVNSALALPPRQCDVGTPYEQANRMWQFCAEQKRNGIINCGYCPIKHQYQRDCTLAWAQMSYAEEGRAQ